MSDPGKVLNVLRSARALIENPRDWWTPARGRLNLCDPGAVCALSAFPITFLEDDGSFQAVRRLSEVMGVESPCAIPHFNDSHSHAEVIAAFDKAIADVESEMADSIVEATPNADAALAVFEACENAGAVLAKQIVASRPDLDFEDVAAIAATEFYGAAQDTAWAFDLGVRVVRADAEAWS